jgi:hypothetical protein
MDFLNIPYSFFILRCKLSRDATISGRERGYTAWGEGVLVPASAADPLNICSKPYLKSINMYNFNIRLSHTAGLLNPSKPKVREREREIRRIDEE